MGIYDECHELNNILSLNDMYLICYYLIKYFLCFLWGVFYMELILIFRRFMRKLLYVGNGNTNGVKGNVNKQNKVLFKCQKERNFYIQREVGDLIKN